ncbi:hypothetical protein HDU84_002607 [Entophlyctis sp. JEL0112]|nr:hypothetical protein HDU84_002607 [Entophlyctis sp. JEL0112]
MDVRIGLAGAGGAASSALISPEHLRRMAARIDPRERLDADVELMLADVAADFLNDVAEQACRAAQHRESQTVEIEDVMLPIDMKWKIRVPGFNQDVQVVPAAGARKQPSRTHTSVVSSVKAALASDSKKTQKKKPNAASSGAGTRSRKSAAAAKK